MPRITHGDVVRDTVGLIEAERGCDFDDPRGDSRRSFKWFPILYLPLGYGEEGSVEEIANSIVYLATLLLASHPAEPQENDRLPSSIKLSKPCTGSGHRN
jgi:hypothetical protein